MVFNPDKLAFKGWTVFIFLATTFTAIELPFRFIFYDKFPVHLAWIDTLLGLIFSIDILVNFNTAFEKNQYLIFDRKKIRKNYLRTWFFVDLIAVIPFYLLIPGLNIGVERLLRLLRLFKVLRLLHNAHPISNSSAWSLNVFLNPVFFPLVRFFYWLFLVSHWLTIGFLSLDEIPVNQDIRVTYFEGLYWTMSTLTTVGYGDVSATNIAQRIYSILCMIIGIGLYGYLVGRITYLFTQLNVKSREIETAESEMQFYMRHHGVPANLQRQIRRYYSEIQPGLYYKSARDVFPHLPENYIEELENYSRLNFLYSYLFLEGLPDRELKVLAREMEEVRLEKESALDWSRYPGSIGLIAYGILLLEYDDLEKVRVKSSFFGHELLLKDGEPPKKVLAMEKSKVYILSASLLAEVEQSFPEHFESLKNRIFRKKD